MDGTVGLLMAEWPGGAPAPPRRQHPPPTLAAVAPCLRVCGVASFATAQSSRPPRALSRAWGPGRFEAAGAGRCLRWLRECALVAGIVACARVCVWWWWWWGGHDVACWHRPLPARVAQPAHRGAERSRALPLHLRLWTCIAESSHASSVCPHVQAMEDGKMEGDWEGKEVRRHKQGTLIRGWSGMLSGAPVC